MTIITTLDIVKANPKWGTKPGTLHILSFTILAAHQGRYYHLKQMRFWEAEYCAQWCRFGRSVRVHAPHTAPPLGITAQHDPGETAACRGLEWGREPGQPRCLVISLSAALMRHSWELGCLFWSGQCDTSPSKALLLTHIRKKQKPNHVGISKWRETLYQQTDWNIVCEESMGMLCRSHNCVKIQLTLSNYQNKLSISY